MSEYANAEDTIRRMLVQYEGLKEVADLFSQAGGLRSMCDSLTKRRNTLQEQISAEVTNLDDIKRHAEIQLREANDAATRVTSEAEAKAKTIVEEAEKTAAAAMETQKQNYEKQFANLRSAIESAQKEHTKIAEEVALIAQTRDAILAQHKDASEALATVEAAIAKLTNRNVVVSPAPEEHEE